MSVVACVIVVFVVVSVPKFKLLSIVRRIRFGTKYNRLSMNTSSPNTPAFSTMTFTFASMLPPILDVFESARISPPTTTKFASLTVWSAVEVTFVRLIRLSVIIVSISNFDIVRVLLIPPYVLHVLDIIL